MQTIDLQALSQTVPSNSSGKMSVRSDMQRLGTRCWQLLITKGVPPSEARELAIAIIRFIYLNISPSHRQKSLINRYYQHLSSPELLSLQC
ncbi:MAG: hypothetical protein AAF959_12680 [Cyanobacteria bacterium P01_D01_bin.56]